MRAALWLVALFAVAVAVALLAGHNQTTVTVFWPPYRLDMSINLVVVLLLAGFVALHLALRGFAWHSLEKAGARLVMASRC